jgi:uncharacterized protein
MESFDYEWDEAKRAANLAKHGVDFTAMARFDWSRHVLFRDGRRDYGEARFLAYAPIDGRLYALIFAYRGPIRRIISLRKANRREQASYQGRD